MIYKDIIAGVQTNNEMNISFKFSTLPAIMKSAYDAIANSERTKNNKQLFHIEDNLPEFARYLECFFPRLKKLKFNNVLTVEDLAKIPEIKNAPEYHKYLQEKGYINKKNNLIEDLYFYEKNNELPDNDFFNKLLPLEFLK